MSKFIDRLGWWFDGLDERVQIAINTILFLGLGLPLLIGIVLTMWFALFEVAVFVWRIV